MRLARWIATGFGSGFFPVAPGTAGSLVGLATWCVLPEMLRGTGVVALVFLGVAFLVGVLASDRAEREFGHDAGPIVVDEVVGQWISLAGLPLTPLTLVAGFLLFRVFDVLKPFPAGRSQSLPGGLGIMTDDLFAGLWAQLVLRVAFHFLGVPA